MLKGIRVTVDAHRLIAFPRSNSYTDTAVQFATNSMICPELQMSWQGRVGVRAGRRKASMSGPPGGGQMGVRASRIQGKHL